MNKTRAMALAGFACIVFDPSYLAEAALPDVSLAPGDIVVNEFFDGLVRGDPVTGEQAELGFSSGSSPSQVVVDREQIVYVNVQSDIIRFDSKTDTQSLVVANVAQVPIGLAVESNDSLLVAAIDEGLLRVDLTTGNVSTLWQAPTADVRDVAVSSTGRIFVVEGNADLLEIDPVTGESSTLPIEDIDNPIRVDVHPSGDLIVIDAGAPILRIDPESGQQTVVLPSSAPFSIRDLSIESNGDIVIGAFMRVDRIDDETGAVTTLVSETLFVAIGIAVVPQSISEPSTSVLGCIGLLGLGFVSRSR